MEKNNQKNQQEELEKAKIKFENIIFVIRLIFAGLLIIILIWNVVLWIARKKLQSSQPSYFSEQVTNEKITEKEDSVSTINQELEKIEILNLDEEFRLIDEDLNYL